MMFMMLSFCAVLFFPLDVLDEILDLTDLVSEGFPTYSYILLGQSQPQEITQMNTMSLSVIKVNTVVSFFIFIFYVIP